VPTSRRLTTRAAAPAGPLAPIGTPDGGVAFTIWQPMTATYRGETVVGQQIVPLSPGAITIPLLGLTWSPDGSYLESAGNPELIVQTNDEPLPSAQALAELQISGDPAVQVRDAGLQHALSESAFTPAGGLVTQLLAWRPDGGLLAAEVVSDNYRRPLFSTTVKLYSCSTGNLLASLTPARNTRTLQTSAGTSPFPVSLLWSPDGAHLLALDLSTTTITIWPASLLPH
jgi:hypothetical protein